MEIRVKPAEGTEIADDRGRPIPPAGKTVEKSIRIARAIREGSLIVVSEDTTPKKTTGKGDKK